MFPSDAAQQARNALADINDVLKKAGASLAHAVASRVYVTDLEAADAVTPVLERCSKTFGQPVHFSFAKFLQVAQKSRLRLQLQSQSEAPFLRPR